MKEIVQQNEKVLRKISHEVPLRDIKTPKIKKILREMSASLKSQDDGVAIAAPQIGYSLRIFVVSGKIFDEAFLQNRDEREEDKSKEVLKTKPKTKNLIFINPKIVKLSREKDWMPEGCLSVRWLYGQTYRSKKATIEAYNETGKKIKMGASGLLAQIFQHETDHLNGILFIDHAKDIREENPE